MRKFIVKNFALSNRVKIFGTEYVWLRASNIIFPSFCFLVWGFIFSDLTEVRILMSIPFIVSSFFGFIYFDLKPVDWTELDDEQKLFYGRYYWVTLPQYRRDKVRQLEVLPYNNRNRILLALVNPVFGIVTAILSYLYL